jgi:hypothetical protein
MVLLLIWDVLAIWLLIGINKLHGMRKTIVRHNPRILSLTDKLELRKGFPTEINTQE